MGTFHVRVEVAGPARERFVPVDLLVDTGSTYTVLPRALLHDLGVEVESRARFVLANGSNLELDRGRAWVRFEGREQYTLVVFGDDALLGAVTLEEFLLAPDPVEGRLVPVPALLKRAAA
ncbi:MAG TPA: aspartyl protease family protein [Gaiellaceae bacterium]|nr:aspartyl protease family protein [Gaiellaceae bacterium]